MNLVLFAIGAALNIFGYWVRFQSTSNTTASSDPAEQFHSGQVFSAIGLLFIAAGLVFAVVSIVLRFTSSPSTAESAASSRDSEAAAVD